MLTVIGFDFEYVMPWDKLKCHDLEQQYVELIYIRSPHRAYFLFYPPELLASAVIHYYRHNNEEEDSCASADVKMLVEDFKLIN
jgi:hypothetical protein